MKATAFAAAALVALAACTIQPKPPLAGEQPNVLVMGEDADQDTVPCSNRIFVRALRALTEEMHLKGFDTYDETAVTLNDFVQGRCRRTDAEVIDISRSITRPPIDVVTLFSIYASAKRLNYTTKIDVRVTGRMLHVPNGRHLGTFEVELPEPAIASGNCLSDFDRECLLEEVGDETRYLARELGAVLALKLDALSPTAEDAVLRGSDEAGLAAAYPLVFEGFTPEEINDIEEYFVAFQGYEHHRPMRCGVRICEYWYETKSDTARLKRNLTQMLDYLGVTGRVDSTASRFTVQKIASPESR